MEPHSTPEPTTLRDTYGINLRYSVTVLYTVYSSRRQRGITDNTHLFSTYSRSSATTTVVQPRYICICRYYVFVSLDSMTEMTFHAAGTTRRREFLGDSQHFLLPEPRSPRQSTRFAKRAAEEIAATGNASSRTRNILPPLQNIQQPTG